MHSYSSSGILITLEGIDGSGKTSAAQALYHHLKELHSVVLTREPGGTQLGSVLRTLLQERTFKLDPKAEYLLFAADRAQHIQEIVLPALAKGQIVLSDRMADSSYAYQGYGRGVTPSMIHQVNRWAMHEREPDLTLYIMISYEEARRRLGVRNEQTTVFEKEQDSFFERVAKGFEAAFALRSADNLIIRIDGHHDEKRVHREIIEAVELYLAQRGLL
jgi:dTMP kinase